MERFSFIFFVAGFGILGVCGDLFVTGVCISGFGFVAGFAVALVRIIVVTTTAAATAAHTAHLRRIAVVDDGLTLDRQVAFANRCSTTGGIVMTPVCQFRDNDRTVDI